MPVSSAVGGVGGVGRVGGVAAPPSPLGVQTSSEQLETDDSPEPVVPLLYSTAATAEPDFTQKHPLESKWTLWFDNPDGKQKQFSIANHTHASCTLPPSCHPTPSALNYARA